jgi:anti-sigma factor RsiW
MSERQLTDDEREELTAYLDGETDTNARTQFEAKLHQDPALKAEADAMKAAWALLDQLPKAEPSADFTHRTLHRLATVGSMPALTAVTPSFWRLMPWGRVAIIFVALVLGWAGAGAWQRRGPPHLRPDDPELLRDLRVIDQLPVYAPVETLEFLTALDHPDLFGSEVPGP